MGSCFGRDLFRAVFVLRELPGLFLGLSRKLGSVLRSV